MREFEIEQVSFNAKWHYKRIIPALPVAGTEAFGILCKRLAPFGLSASRILLDAPSNKLGDAVLTVILLDGRLGIKFSVSSFEIIVDELYEDDERNISDIAKVLFEALKKIDSEVDNGNVGIRLMYHLKLEAGENSKFMSEYLIDTNTRLAPEMAIFQVSKVSESILQNSKVAIAKSAPYENAIFMDINLDYSRVENIANFPKQIENDVVDIFNIFSLRELKTDN